MTSRIPVPAVPLPCRRCGGGRMALPTPRLLERLSHSASLDSSAVWEPPGLTSGDGASCSCSTADAVTLGRVLG